MHPLRTATVTAALLLAGSLTATTSTTFDELAARVAADAETRRQNANEALLAARERVSNEKVPLLERLRQAEARVLAADREKRRIDTRHEQTGADRRRLARDIDATRKVTGFSTTLTRDSLKALLDGLPPGEPKHQVESLQALLDRLSDPEAAPTSDHVVEALDRLVGHVSQRLGGHAARGHAMSAGTNRVLEGIFAFVGPEVYFRADDGSEAGTVRRRDGSSHAVVHALPGWEPAAAAALFGGNDGSIIADPTGGKALRLHDTRGSVWEHIGKGGVVAYVIVLVGVLAILLVLQKVRDLWRMDVDPAASIDAALGAVARDDGAEAERLVASLKSTTRSLFAVGLRHRRAPKSLLEEHLESTLLELKIHFERRLPLLAVIATAAPLLGLFGTVVGMVKTFSLITVFGTGNAAKLSSGISEVLVATELGLAVAIPALIAHGFLAHRFEKNLGELERCALKFVIAAETARASRQAELTPT